MKIRYVITMVTHSGLRVLATANRGQYHRDSQEDAERYLAAILANNSASLLESVYGDVTKMKVIPAECYDHGDCMKTVFCD